MQIENDKSSVTPLTSSNEVEIQRRTAIKQLAKGVLLGVLGEIFSHFINKATSRKNNKSTGQGSGHRKRRKQRRND